MVDDRTTEVVDSGYKKLKIYRTAHDLAIKVHQVTLQLPKFEMFEEGSQVRRSSKSISSNIVEGYGLRCYKAGYIHYLFRAYASSLETMEHLEYLYETGSLKDQDSFETIKQRYSELNRMIFKFVESVERQYDTSIFNSTKQWTMTKD